MYNKRRNKFSVLPIQSFKKAVWDKTWTKRGQNADKLDKVTY